MARIITCGWELQSTASGVELEDIGTAPAIETTIVRSGAAAMRANASAESHFGLYSSGTSVIFLQSYVRFETFPSVTLTFLRLRNGTSAKIGIKCTAAGVLQLFNEEDSTQIGSDSSAISTGTWYRIALGCDPTTLSSTSVEARAYVDTAGASTFWNPSGTANLAAVPNTFYIGAAVSGGVTVDIVYDDFVINDNSGSFQNTWPPENKIIILRPNGNGDNSQWTGSDGNSTDNYLLVDETPPDDVTTYVASNTLDQIDDYNLDATPAALGSGDTINCVQVGWRAAASAATSTDPDFVVRIKSDTGATVEESSAVDMSTTTYTTNALFGAVKGYALTLYDLPGGSTTAWTKATLDTAQIGVREAATDADSVRLTALWLTVDFTPASVAGSASISPSASQSPSASVSQSPSISASASVSQSASLSQSASVSPSTSVSPSVSPSISPSASVSQSASVSPSTSVSPSVSPSISPSASVSQSPSISPSSSASAGGASVSPSTSVSPSVSPSASVSKSTSPSVSPSVSPSISPSASVSPSVSPSRSVSPSASVSPSVSPSTSVSPSVSPSISPSASASRSASPSASTSPSSSVSASQSPSASTSPSASVSASISPSVAVTLFKYGTITSPVNVGGLLSPNYVGTITSPRVVGTLIG